MKKIFSIHNVFLILVVVLIGVLSLNIKEAKAAGTVTWNGPSSITIRETIKNIANPIVASREYNLWEDFGDYDDVATATINYTASDTIINNQITKTAVLDVAPVVDTLVSKISPGDYNFTIDPSSGFWDSNNKDISSYFPQTEETLYEMVISIRNIVDANNNPTGDFNASLIIQKCTYDEQTEEPIIEKIAPVSGVLYADFNYETNPDHFGHIEISKTVKGIGADTAEYFSMVITVNNVPGIASSTVTYLLDATGYVYPITGIDASVSYNGSTINNPATITVGTPVTIYIKHGQTAVIGQVTKSSGETFDAIPKGAVYSGQPRSYNRDKAPQIKRLGELADGSWVFGSYFTVSEDAKDYTPSFIVNNGNITSGYSVPNTGIDSGTNTLDFYNEKEMSPVTGLIFTILPYAILAAIGIGGTLLVMHLKKEEKKTSQ